MCDTPTPPWNNLRVFYSPVLAGLYGVCETQMEQRLALAAKRRGEQISGLPSETLTAMVTLKLQLRYLCVTVLFPTGGVCHLLIHI